MSVIHSMSLGDIALGGFPARKGSVYYLRYLIFFLTFNICMGLLGILGVTQQVLCLFLILRVICMAKYGKGWKNKYNS